MHAVKTHKIVKSLGDNLIKFIKRSLSSLLLTLYIFFPIRGDKNLLNTWPITTFSLSRLWAQLIKINIVSSTLILTQRCDLCYIHMRSPFQSFEIYRFKNYLTMFLKISLCTLETQTSILTPVESQSEPQRFNQDELNDLVSDLNFGKKMLRKS